MIGTPVPAAKQIEQLNQRLLQLFVQKHDAEKALATAEEQIQAIRNLMAGVGTGQQLEREAQAVGQVPAP